MNPTSDYFSSEHPARVVVADDHTQHRRLVALILGLDPRIRVVGQACDGDEAVEMVRGLRPDVALLDSRMPQLSGTEACLRIGAEAPSTHCVMLTMADDPDEIEAALTAGIKGYLFKATSADDIIETVLRVAEQAREASGLHHVPSRITKALKR